MTHEIGSEHPASNLIGWLKDEPIAHRGLHDGNIKIYENTLASLDAAASEGYAIECDVVLSRDGQAMLFHDLTLDRITAEKGDLIARDASELKQVQIGGTEQYIATLAEALAVVAGRVSIVVELKGHDPANHDLVTAVARDLEHYKGQAAIMSFDPWLVREFATIAPHIPRGLTAEGNSRGAIESHFSMLAHNLDFISYHVRDLPNPFISFCRDKLAMPVITWTVRDDEAVTITKTYADQITFEGFKP